MESDGKATLTTRERTRGSRCCEDDPEARLDADEARQLSEDMQVLAHPVRLQILDVLARREGQVCVCDLEAAVPVKQPTISHHLKLLRAAGLIDCERQGLWAYYAVRRERLAAMRARIAAQLDAMA